jgi:photosystem II stability/assembly factor-like uncharacterized protein
MGRLQTNSTNRCPFYVVVASLISLLAVACASGRWELLRADSLSDGVPILALYFSDKDHGWAVTPGELLKLAHSGSEWLPVLSNTGIERTFESLVFTSPANGVIVGSKHSSDGFTSLVLRTTDGGLTWEERPVNVSPVKDIHMPHGLHGLSFCNANVGWAVGNGLIIRTTDQGKTWDTQRSGNTEERLFGIACAGPERAWAVGPDGLLLRTIDAGKTWSRQEIDPKYSLVRIRFFGEDGWMLGEMAERGLLLHTSDGGSTWRPQAIETSESLLDIYMNGTQGWVVGSNGTISHTSNGGQSWEKQQAATTNDLACLFFLSPDEGWAGGAKRTLLHFRNQ